MLTFKVDKDAVVTYYQDGEAFPDQWPYTDKAAADLHAQAICDLYNDVKKNPDGVKYPNPILSAKEKAEQAGLILPK